MKEWILSVVGVIALGVLVDILLPEGKIAKYVKGAFSLLVVLVISSILPIIANANLTIDIDSSDYFAVESANAFQSFEYIEEVVEQELEKNGCECDVQIEWENTLAKCVTVRVSKSDISAETIVHTVARTLNISINCIIVLYV